jgi:hypothetical protein
MATLFLGSATEYREANSHPSSVLALRSKMANSIEIPIVDLQKKGCQRIAGYRGPNWTDQLSAFASLLLCGSACRLDQIGINQQSKVTD